MKHFYCSTFSKDYIYKGILLYESLLQHDKDFHFFMICFDDEVKSLVDKMNLKNLTTVALSDIEKADKDLLEAKKSRNDKEYIWTSKGSVMLYILNNFDVDHIVWLDGDTFFYSDPKPIFDEWIEVYSIMLTKERWRKEHESRNLTTGIYNTGFMGFKRDEYGLEALQWFRKKLIEWCYDKRERGLWSDQVYVNDWPKRFNRVGVIKNIGVNVTPYIMENCQVTRDSSKKIYVNGKKLIFYHSYGFKYYDGNEFDLCYYQTIDIADKVIEWVYLPYIHAAKGVVEKIQKVDSNFYNGGPPKDNLITNYFNLKLKNDSTCHHLCTIITKEYLIKGKALYNSLLKRHSKFHLWICCVDHIAYDILSKMKLEKATVINIKMFKDWKIKKIEKTRETSEFCWSLKAPFAYYILKNNYYIDSMIYLDADLFLYEDVGKIYEEWGEKSVYLTQLRLKPNLERKKGKYSAALVGFKRDSIGMEILRGWRKDCLLWCYDRFEPKRWADQKYLDYWPDKTTSIQISTNFGINLGPWNLFQGKIVPRENGQYFEEFKINSYHFSGFEVINDKEFELCYRMKLPCWIGDVYHIYVEEIFNVISEIKKIDSSFVEAISKDAKDQKLYNYYYYQSSVSLDEKNDQDKYHICTLLSKDFLIQGLTLYNSLKKNNVNFHLWICCVDNESHEALGRINLKHATLIPYDNIKDETLDKLKSQRKIHEFCWTLKPFIIHYLIKNNINIDKIFYVDADIFFFDSLEGINREWGDESIYLTKQYLAPRAEKRHGKFNSGFIGFKRDYNAMEVLKWWRDKCIEWCFDRFEENRWSDQKYLDQWSSITSSIKVSENLGVNLGPWNVRKFNEKSHLICYHFSGFRILNDNQFIMCNRKKIPQKAEKIYKIYVKEVKRAINQLKDHNQDQEQTLSNLLVFPQKQNKHFPSTKKPNFRLPKR